MLIAGSDQTRSVLLLIRLYPPTSGVVSVLRHDLHSASRHHSHKGWGGGGAVASADEEGDDADDGLPPPGGAAASLTAHKDLMSSK